MPEKKISIKHYLNTNLRPYLVKGEKYFSIYLLITVNRRTTKIPSNAFTEMHTELDFQKIDKSVEARKERELVTTLIVAMMKLVNDFDTQLLSALYNLMPKYSLFTETFEVSVASVKQIRSNWDEMVLGLKGLNSRQHQAGISFYDWYNPNFHAQNEKFLSSRGLRKGSIENLDVVVVASFFEILSLLVKSLKKYEQLEHSYPALFEDYTNFALAWAKAIK